MSLCFRLLRVGCFWKRVWGKAEKTEKSERKFYILTNFADNKIKENLL